MQVRYYGPEGPGAAEGLREGDVLASNHPQLAGGSHLPDITVITPVFAEVHLCCCVCFVNIALRMLVLCGAELLPSQP